MEDHILPSADVLTISVAYMSLKQWPALTARGVTVQHPDADSWRAKFSCNLSSLIQIRSMVNLKKKKKKKKQHVDSPQAFSDSYVIIKKMIMILIALMF